MTQHVHRILVGIDGSSDSRRALEWAMLLADRFDAELLAVHAVGLLSRLGEGSPVPSQSHRDELRQLFESEWCAPLVHQGTNYRTFLEDGPPVLVLLQVAEREQADLSVVGSRGEGGFAELLLGSTSHQLAEHSGRPVLIVPGERRGPA